MKTPSNNEKDPVLDALRRIGGSLVDNSYEVSSDDLEASNAALESVEEDLLSETYNDYPESATNNAKRALKYKDENPDNKCGTPVGWARANQLAKREKISRDTIARMSSFKRHQKSKDVPYSEGCGGLMWDAWGGTSGVEWANRKLEQIDKKKKDSMSKKLSFGVSSILETKVDKDIGSMLSVSLISIGLAKGHDLYVDSRSLETLLDQLDGTRLPAYITHSGAIFEDRLTREIGYFDNFNIEGDRLVGDFKAFESFRDDDARTYNRLFEMAEKMPGLSIVFSATSVWATEDGDVPSEEAPDDSLFDYPSIRVEEVSSADFVDSPAANERGLFSKIDTKPNTKMTKAELIELNKELEEQNKSLALSVTESEALLEELRLSLKEDEEKEEESLVEEEVVEVVEDSEEEVIEDSKKELEEDSEEELEDSKTLPDARPMEEQIEELKKDIESKLEKIEDLKAKLEEKEGDISEKDEELEEKSDKEEEMEAKLSSLSSKLHTLEKLIEGSDLVHAPTGDEVYEPSKASRSKVISEFAKKNNISEFAATLRLGKDRPEIFKL